MILDFGKQRIVECKGRGERETWLRRSLDI
jgi:hypothetical protein